MKQISVMPTEGQFVAIWEYDGEIWSGTYKYNKGRLMVYINCECEQCEGHFDECEKTMVSDLSFAYNKGLAVRFFVMERE